MGGNCFSKRRDSIGARSFSEALARCGQVLFRESEGHMRDLSVIVRMVEQGMSRKEIAYELGVPLAHVRDSLTMIYRELGYTGGKGKFKRLQERVKQKGAA